MTPGKNGISISLNCWNGGIRISHMCFGGFVHRNQLIMSVSVLFLIYEKMHISLCTLDILHTYKIE